MSTTNEGNPNSGATDSATVGPQADEGSSNPDVASLALLASDQDLADIFGDEQFPEGTVSSLDREPPGSSSDRPRPAATATLTRVKPAPTVVVSPDGMSASITLAASPDGYSEAEVAEALKHAGVSYGIDWSRLMLLLAKGQPARLIPIAQGDPAKPGVDARIEYLFDLVSGDLQEHAGRVDWRELNLIHSVAPGQPLARKHPPEQGVAGTNVRGQKTSLKHPRDFRVALGPGTALSEDDPNVVIATVAGAVRMDPSGRLSVDNTYVVKGDVDLSTGNVDFAGSVVIQKDVKKGFVIKATGDVEVRGVVEDAQIIAGGSLIAAGGILGSSRTATIQAGQDIMARFANNARLIAGNDVLLGQEAINCEIEAEGKVVVGGKVPTKGFIRGGTVTAAQEIVAFSIGAAAGTGATRLRSGYDWLVPRKLQSVETELIQRQAQLERAIVRLRELRDERGQGELSTGKRMMLEKLSMTEEALRGAVRALEHRRARWMKVAETKGSISIHGTAHPGCELCIDGSTRVLTESREGERFVAEGGAVMGLGIKA